MDCHLSLDALIRKYPGACHLLRRHGIDFLHQGEMSLSQIYPNAQSAAQVLGEIEELAELIRKSKWENLELAEIADFIRMHFHEHHRLELPQLILLASKVERRWAKDPLCPRGLAQYLDRFQQEMRRHMLEEEEMLFPHLSSLGGLSEKMAELLNDHNDIGASIQKIDTLCQGFKCPTHADADWKALYKGIQLFMAELWEHVSMENHFLMGKNLEEEGISI